MSREKIVTAYWMDCEGYPFQGTQIVRKERYKGSLISHCKGIDLPIVCYTHDKNFKELCELKQTYNLDNLEIKILELSNMKLHKEISKVRDKKFDINLDGRGPEIMWGKFDVLERELDGFDYVYWVDVGLQNPTIFPWRYCGKYNKIEDHIDLKKHWWAELDTYNFNKLFNTKIFKKLKQKCENKIFFLTSINPQISYPFLEKGIIDYSVSAPYPVGGLFGGNTSILKKYINYYWEFCNLVLNKDFLCTEECVMKIAFDKMNAEELFNLNFASYHSGTHDEFHFEMWTEKSSNSKPLYMVWHDILNYE